MPVTVKIPKAEFDDFILKLSHNGGYCPCKVDKTQETKCPCKDFRVNGICECGVYINR
jgi:hypothetical protein